MQCDTLKNVVKILIDKDYYALDSDSKTKILKTKALANCINTNSSIVNNSQITNIQDIDGKFFINNEITYILSLLLTNKVIILEEKNANIFAKSINKDNIENNYIILNRFAKEILYNTSANN